MQAASSRDDVSDNRRGQAKGVKLGTSELLLLALLVLCAPATVATGLRTPSELSVPAVSSHKPISWSMQAQRAVPAN
jgi:hypothetical protein